MATATGVESDRRLSTESGSTASTNFPTSPVEKDDREGSGVATTAATKSSVPLRPVFPKVHVGDSLRTTVSDSIQTPQSPLDTYGIGAYVESPTTATMTTRGMSSPSGMKLPGAWPTRSPKHTTTGLVSDSPSSAATIRAKPDPLDLDKDAHTVDLTDPPPLTAMSNSSTHSMSTELLDLSNLRKSMQQNLRDRPLGDDADLGSIDESRSDVADSISPQDTIGLLNTSPQLLVIDTRVLEEYSTGHLPRSVNVSIPSLLLSRLLKQTTRAGVAGWVSLTRYVSTAAGQEIWDGVDLSKHLDVVVIGTDESDVDAVYALAAIIEPLVSKGTVRVVEGGWPAIAGPAKEKDLIVADVPTIVGATETEAPSRPTLNTSRLVPHVSPASAAPAPSQTFSPMASAGPRSVPGLTIHPSPASAVPRRPPKLQLNLDSGEPPEQPVSAPQRGRPKLGGLTIDVGSSRVPGGPQSALPLSSQVTPGTLTPMQGARSSTLAPPGEPWNGTATPIHAAGNYSNLPPPTPTGPSHSHNPLAQLNKPIDVSTVLPSFLFLGPEITTQADVDELQRLGVRRILNVAVECNDDEGLGLSTVFEKYYRIPMKDSVDESGVGKGIREACEILDDARLHSSPTYVHCKAGKSRSVTVVLAYLIHANAWTLHTSYQYVAARRHGISPNIGFVAELMEYETAELGPKREEDSKDSSGNDEPLVHREPRIGPRYTRESLPPEFGSERLVGDDDEADEDRDKEKEPDVPENTRLRGRKPQPDIEVRKNGQWVLRRTPVDRITLQPSRRVSKAGLESMMIRPLAPPDE